MLLKKVLIGAIQDRTDRNGQKPEDGYGYVLKGFIVEDPNNDEINQGQALDIKLKSVNGLKAKQTLEFGNSRGQVTLVNPIGKVWGDFSNNLSLKADKIIMRKEDANEDKN